VRATEGTGHHRLYGAGEAPGHAQSHEPGEGGDDTGTLGVRERVHERFALGDDHVRPPHPDPQLHVVHLGGALGRPRSAVPQPSDDQQLLALVEGIELEGAAVQREALMVVRCHDGAGRSTTRYDHSSLWRPTG
jgi:hypothetical protein